MNRQRVKNIGYGRDIIKYGGQGIEWDKNLKPYEILNVFWSQKNVKMLDT